MNEFYVILFFIGTILISFSLILVLIDKKKVFSFIKHYEEKKKELVEIINDAEQMIEELNKFSDYIITQVDLKYEELSVNLNKAHEEINELTKKIQSIPTDKNDKVISINNRNNEVLRLFENGMGEVDIARQLNMGKGEIQLILELNR